MSKILVTGSRGTLGVPLVEELKKRGHDVFGLDLQHNEDPKCARANIQNIRELEQMFERFGHFDYVYHLAAEFGRNNGEDYYESLWKTNAVGTKHLLTLQERGFFDRMIFASSSEVYGEGHGEIALTEELPDESPLFHYNDYAMSKWVNERQIRNHRTRTGKEVMTLRFFNAYGPGEHYHRYRSVVCLFCYQALMGEGFTVYKDYHRVFMYIDDFTPTLANVVDNFVDGETVNIGGEEYRSVEDLAEIVIKETGLDPSKVTYLEQESHNVQNKRPDILKAKRMFNHSPSIRLEEGIRNTLDWMREEYGFR